MIRGVQLSPCVTFKNQEPLHRAFSKRFLASLLFTHILHHLRSVSNMQFHTHIHTHTLYTLHVNIVSKCWKVVGEEKKHRRLRRPLDNRKSSTMYNISGKSQISLCLCWPRGLLLCTLYTVHRPHIVYVCVRCKRVRDKIMYIYVKMSSVHLLLNIILQSLHY